MSGPTIEVRLLGGFEVRIDGEPLDALRSGRARSLLAYLILHADVVHTRAKVAFAFWPDSSEGQARTNLRNLLFTVRQAHPAMESAVKTTSTTLQWQPDDPATVDVDRFVDEVTAAAAGRTTADVIAGCERAVEAYGGDLLAGDYDDWVLSRRDALRDQYRDTLRRLATALIDDARADEATSIARELVRVDPLDEASHRLRIEAHHAAGDRAGAVRAYHECAATLERELGVGPVPETTTAYLAALEAPRDERTERERLTVPSRSGLVGRDDEWDELVAAWHDVQHGPTRVVLVTGEPGIGKTRMIDELRLWCARAGAVVADARAYASEGDLGGGVVVSWLRCPDVRLALESLPPVQRAALARLLPELGAAGAVDGIDDAERRLRLFDAAATALGATGRPTLLVADDCQWSDQLSLEFVHYLARQHEGAPLLIALTARHEELDAAHPLTVLCDALKVLDRLTELPLERLSRHATGEVGSQVAGQRLDDDAIAALYTDTEGNPLFIVETIRSGWPAGGSAVAMTPRLRAVIDGRLRRLSDAAAEVLGATAVVGRPCSAELLARVCGLDDRTLARAIDELWRRGILSETGRDAYEFSHGKLRDAAYENLTPATRKALHVAVARFLAERADTDPESSSSQVAVHFEAAGRADEAVTWFQRAAIDALRVFAFDESVRLLDRALALVPSLPADVRHVRELELLSALPVPLAAVAGFATERMQEAHRRGAAVAASLGVELDPAFVRSMVMSALCRDEFADAASAAAQLLDHAVSTGDDSLRVESHYLLGIAAFWAVDLDRAREQFETVIAEFEPSTRAQHLDRFGHDPQVVCESRLANTLWFLGREEDARATCAQALARAEAAGHAFSHGTAATFACLLAVDLDDPEMLRRSLRELVEFGVESLPFTTNRESYFGLLDAYDGQPAAGIARIRAALDACEGRNYYPGFQAAVLRVLVAACAVTGDAEGGLAASGRALRLDSTPLWDAELHRARAAFLQASGAAAASVHEELRLAEAVARAQSAGGHLRRIETLRQTLAKRSTADTPVRDDHHL